MNLAQTIISNEKSGQLQKNRLIIASRLSELVSRYSDQVIEVLHKSGITLSSVLPKKVVLTILVKNLHRNKLLRETITKMLFEMDGYYNAEGEKLTILGGALSAVGTILSGIGRGQTQSDQSQVEQQLAIQQQQQQQIAQDQKRRTTIIVISISVIVILGAVFIFLAYKKATPKGVEINTSGL